MRKLAVIFTVVALSVMMAGVAGAALTSTSHNMIAHDALTDADSKQGACSFCHIPHGATGTGLFPSSAAISGTSDWVGDPVATLCWSCHGLATAYNDAQSVMPFQAVLDGAHGRDATELLTGGVNAGGDISATSNLSGVYGYSGTTQFIGCQSCHNPHDNSKRPFLRDNGAGLVNGDFSTLCNDCHINRSNTALSDAASGTRQNHPADNRALAGVLDASNLKDWNAGLGTYSNRFDSTWADLSIELTRADAPAVANDQHWNLGGKFKNDGTGAGASTGEINCATCHMVHSDEADEGLYVVDNGLAADANPTNPVNWAPDDLLVLSATPAIGAIAAVCDGCHDTTGAPGPGGTGFTHPFNTQESTWNGVSIAAAPNGAKFPGVVGSTRTIVCQSCHDMHIARLDDTTAASPDYALQRNYCEDCHQQDSAKTDHHPSGIDVDFGVDLRSGATASDPPTIGNAMAWNTLTRDEVQANTLTGWGTAGTAYRFAPAVALEGVMSCATCHYSTAHNNAAAFPGIVGDNIEATMCVDCHGVNPSVYTGRNTASVAETGTHFLGDTTETRYLWAGGGVTKDSVTPIAGTAQVYGADGVNDQIICTSCHLILTDTYAVQTADNLNDNEVGTANAIGLMLTPSGNNTPDTATVNDFLCTACHGTSPSSGGSGTTHPVQPTLTSISAEVWTNASVANNGVTVVGDNTSGTETNKDINCESCHRAHNAADAYVSGTGKHYILERATLVGTYVDEQVLCIQCHAK